MRCSKFALVLVAGGAISVGLTPAVSRAQESGTTVSGIVSTEDGAPIRGAVVDLIGEAGATRSATVNVRGAYRFDRVSPGAYTALAQTSGYAPVRVSITVGASPVTQDFILELATFSEEITVSFSGEQSQTALKMDAPVLEIPLTVRSYTGSFVKAVDVEEVADLYTYMTGVDRSGNGAYNVNMRGFAAGEPNNLVVDGMPGLAARQNSPNIANIERVEVLKGPASVLYGRAEPGGLVNLVTKRPQPQTQRVVDLRSGTFFGGGPSFGDDSSFRGAIDLTGPVGDGERYLYRFIASYDDSTSFRDFVDSEDLLVAPSFTINFSPSTFLTLEGEYRDIESTLDQGLIAPEQDIDFVAPITTFYQEPGDFENEEGWSLSTFLTHQQGSSTTWNVNTRSVFHEDARKGFENRQVLDDNRTLRRRDRHQVNEREYLTVDANVTHTLTTGNVDHALLIGANAAREERDFDRLRFGNQGFLIDLFEPVYGLVIRPEDPLPGTHRLIELSDYGVYVQDRVTLSERWKALAALRWYGQDAEQQELRFDDPDRDRSVDDLNPMVGIVYQPGPGWSLYGSYANSFDPQDAAAEGEGGRNVFDPEEGEQIEAGVKAAVLGGRLDATLGLFQITKQNVLVPTGFGFDEQIGEERSRGMELEVRARPQEYWQLIFGYAFIDAEVTEDTREDRQGADLRNTPENAFNLWSRYDFHSGPLANVGFGVGLIYRDDRAGSFPSQVVRGAPTPGEPAAEEVLILPSYFRTDLGFYYVRDRYEVTLKVNNLFDEEYYESAFNLVRITPGAPRQAVLSVRTRF